MRHVGDSAGFPPDSTDFSIEKTAIPAAEWPLMKPCPACRRHFILRSNLSHAKRISSSRGSGWISLKKARWRVLFSWRP